MVIKTNPLTTYSKAPVCSKIRTKHATQYEQDLEFFNVTLGGK